MISPKLILPLLVLCLFVVSVTAEEDTAKKSLLADVAEQKDWKALKQLIQQGESINSAQIDGMTALHWAVFNQHNESVDLLIEHGANVNAITRYQISPLVIACQIGNVSAATSLIKAKADIEFELPGGETPLLIAARTGNAQIARDLLKHGAKHDAKERKGQNALMWAAAEGNTATIQALIDHGADINAKSSFGFTPLFFAARNGQIEAAKALIEAGVDVNGVITPRNSSGRNPRKSMSALLFAVESAHYELAMMLVKMGANPNDQRSGYAPLHTLSWVRKPNYGDNPEGDPPPRGSGKLSALDFVREMVKAGADVNLQLQNGKGGRAKLNPKGSTPFIFAAKTADLPLMTTFVELGADPLRANADGTTPIIAAAGVGVKFVGEEAGTVEEVKESLEFLLNLGANINDVDKNKETAMHGAAYRSYPEIALFLAEHGANPAKWNHKNKYGTTAIHIAEGKRVGSFKPSPEMVHAIEQAIANWSKKSVQ